MNNILNRILIDWNDTDVEDSGLIKASDVENQMKRLLIYKIDKRKSIRRFYIDIEDIPDTWWTYSEYKDKVYINGEHVQLEDGCTVNVYKPGEYRVYIEDFDKIEEIEDFAFYECTDLMSIIIPNSVTTIRSHAFEGCTSLTSVTIPNSVTLIDNYAFSDCRALTSIDIPNTIREIYPSAFSGCTGLTSVTIPNSVTKIDNSVFSDCTSLTSVTIPNSVTEIGNCAFYGCTNLKTIYVESISKFEKIKFRGGWGAKTKLLGNVELVELKNRLNESLIDWGNTDYSDEQEIISTNNVRASMIFSGCDLMDYSHWLTCLADDNMKTNLIHIVSSILNVLDKDQYFINRSAMHSSVLSNAHGEFKDHFVNKVLKNINPDIETFNDHHFLYWNIRKNPNDYHMFTNALNKLDRNLYSVFNARDLFGKPKDGDKQEYIILPMCPIEGKDILLLYFSIWNDGNNGEYSMGELGVVLNPVILE